MGVSFIFGGILFSFGQVCVGKILNFRGKFNILGGNFQFGKILNLCLEVNFVWANLCMGNLKYFFEGKFFFRGISKLYEGAFLIEELGAKLLNFRVITLKMGVFIKHLGIKIN